jgi:DcmR-like sensory protein/histidine kinase-like protein
MTREWAARSTGLVRQALVYHADEELIRLSVPFLRAGAGAGEPTLVAVEPEHERALMDQLGDVDGITPLGPEHYGDPASALQDEYRLFADLVRKGARRIRIVSEVPHEPWVKWFRYEAATNDVLADFPVFALCPHDLRAISYEVLVDVARTHPFLVRRDGTVFRSPLFARPSSLLAERERRECDPVEAQDPDVVHVDPTPAEARRTVAWLADATRLSPDSADAVRLAAGHVVHNAIVHGRRPIVLVAWAVWDRVVITVTDSGGGPPDPYLALLPLDREADLADANTLYVISQALSDVSMFTGPDGFTVRLVEHA